MLRAEVSVDEGTADPQQQRMVHDDQAQRRIAERQRAYRHARETASPDEQPATGTDERREDTAEDGGRTPRDEEQE